MGQSEGSSYGIVCPRTLNIVVTFSNFKKHIKNLVLRNIGKKII